MEIFVVRHTRLDVPEGLCYGKTEIPVASMFEQEVELIRNQLPTGFDLVVCSTLNRCKMLANALNYSPVKFSEALCEMNFGLWENKRWNDLDQKEVDAWCNDFVNVHPPEGENLLEVYARVSNFIISLQSNNYNRVLLITHAGVIRCINAFYQNIELVKMFDFNPDFDVVYKFTDQTKVG